MGWRQIQENRTLIVASESKVEELAAKLDLHLHGYIMYWIDWLDKKKCSEVLVILKFSAGRNIKIIREKLTNNIFFRRSNIHQRLQ